MNETALAVRSRHLTNLSLSDLLQLGKVLQPTGLLPQHIRTPEQAVAIMLKGQELLVPPMYAMSNIAVIQGKPTANSELMLALIYRDHGDDAVVFEESTAERCTVSYKRRNATRRGQFTFTMQEARTAGLTGGNWQKYPAAMLRARCVSAVARMGFPDSIGGMYTPEELGQVEDVEGEIVTVGGQDVDTSTGEIIPVQGEVVSMAESLGRKILDRARKSAEAMSAEPASDKVTNNIAVLLFEVLGDEQDVDLLIRAIFGNGIKGLRADQAAFIAQWANHEHFKKQVAATLAAAKAEQSASEPVAI